MQRLAIFEQPKRLSPVNAASLLMSVKRVNEAIFFGSLAEKDMVDRQRKSKSLRYYLCTPSDRVRKVWNRLSAGKYISPQKAERIIIGTAKKCSGNVGTTVKSIMPYLCQVVGHFDKKGSRWNGYDVQENIAEITGKYLWGSGSQSLTIYPLSTVAVFRMLLCSATSSRWIPPCDLFIFGFSLMRDAYKAFGIRRSPEQIDKIVKMSFTKDELSIGIINGDVALAPGSSTFSWLHHKLQNKPIDEKCETDSTGYGKSAKATREIELEMLKRLAKEIKDGK